jgi:hypothetical protein
MCSMQCNDNKSQYSTKNKILWHIYKMQHLWSGDEIIITTMKHVRKQHFLIIEVYISCLYSINEFKTYDPFSPKT